MSSEAENVGSVEKAMNTVKILVVHHSPSPATRQMADVVLEAAREAAAEVMAMQGAGEATAGGGATGSGAAGSGAAVEVIERAALEPNIEELLEADAVILGTPANFGYISGALKHYFDCTFREAHEATRGLPVSWWIRGGHDTTGAAKALRSLTTGMNWEIAAEPVEFVGDPAPHHAHLREMAQAVVGAGVMASE